MTSTYSKYVKILKVMYPNFELMDGLEHSILSINFKEDNKCEIYLSLWNIAKDYMLNCDFDYNEALKIMLKEIGAENAKLSDIKYLFYDDLPNPQLN
jgi:hypothetical protein